MQLHTLRPTHKFRKVKRIGRGGKAGWTCGRGSKGQRSRAGRQFEPLIRQIIKRYPKLRGYRSLATPEDSVAVNLDVIDKLFSEKDIVNPVTLLKKQAITFSGKRIPKVKILGRGEITKPLVFQNCSFSKSAKEKVEKAKGIIR